jgi:hypothetical protein
MTFITLLAVTVSIVCALAFAVVGLVEAPWQVLLGGLLVALYALQRQIEADEPLAHFPQPESSLPPRGPIAESPSASPPIAKSAGPSASSVLETEGSIAPEAITATSDSEGQELTYRGIRYRVAQTLNPPQGQPVEGIYRGQRWQR